MKKLILAALAAIAMIFIAWLYRTQPRATFDQINILELPGVRVESVAFSLIKEKLGLSKIRDSAHKDTYKSIFPNSDEFYEGEVLPLIIATEHGIINIVCFGSAYTDLDGFTYNATKIDSSMMINFENHLEKANLFIPYRILLSTNPNSAIKSFVEPYMDNPGIKRNENAALVDFTRCFDADHKIKLFYINDEFCGFRVYRK